jgi:hypothetical protein
MQVKRFVVFRKADRRTEAGAFFNGEWPPAIAMPHAALQPSAEGARVRRAGARLRRVEGHVAETGDLIAGFGAIDAVSKQAAIDQVAQWHVEDTAEFEIRESGCPGGLPGIEPANEAEGPRYLILLKSDSQLEADAIPDAARLDAMARRNDEAVAAGILVAGEGLKSTAKGARVKFAGGRPNVMDGPFAEAKELVAGFWVIRASSMDEAIDWVARYPYASDEADIEIRPLAGATPKPEQ